MSTTKTAVRALIAWARSNPEDAAAVWRILRAYPCGGVRVCLPLMGEAQCSVSGLEISPHARPSAT